MRIGIDGRLLRYRRGIGTFVFHLLQALSQIPNKHDFVVYLDDAGAIPFVPSGSQFEVKVLGPKIYPIWEQVILPWAARNDSLDVLHSPANTAPVTLQGRARVVVSIHDVIFLLSRETVPVSPSAYQHFGRLYYRFITPWAARRSTLVHTISRTSRAEIVKYLGVSEEKVRVIHLAGKSSCRRIDAESELKAVRKKYSLEGSIILALGHVDPRKNTQRVIESFAAVTEQLGSEYRLAVVGVPQGHQSRFQKRAKQLGVADRMSLLSFVSDEDLTALYNIAEVFVYPSLYEGFGLPILEAMMCGTPVVTSTAGAIAEVADGAAMFVDPNSSVDIARGIVQVLTHHGIASELREAGFAQARRFSWSQTATEMLQLYEEAAGS